MRIGIIGPGKVGGTLGRHFAEMGHRVMFGSRHPAALDSLVATTGQKSCAGSIGKAAEFGEVVVLALPFDALDEVADALAHSLLGKLVIDTSNRYQRPADGEYMQAPLGRPASSVQELAQKLPGSHIVKAFNTMPVSVLADQAGRPEPRTIAVYFSGNDARTNAIARSLIVDTGFAPVAVGDLDDARLQEPDGPLYGKILSRAEAERMLAIALRTAPKQQKPDDRRERNAAIH
jgi:predicted dinucleotide-binding enzyme